MCESKVQAWEKPRSSAFLVSSTTRPAGGLVWSVTPKSMRSPILSRATTRGARHICRPWRRELVRGRRAYLSGRLGFADRFGGPATDHGERQVRDGGDAEGEEQAVVVQALDERGVRENAGKIFSCGGLQEAGDDG